MSDRELYEEGLLMDLAKAKARIEEMEAENADLKDKLAKAVEAFTRIDFAVTNEKDPDTGFWIECSISEFTAGIVHATLAELTGGKDE